MSSSSINKSLLYLILIKACEGKPEFDLLEHNSVYEAEGGVVAPLIVGADWLTGRKMPHNYFVIVLFTEREVFLITFLEAKDVKIGVDG